MKTSKIIDVLIKTNVLDVHIYKDGVFYQEFLNDDRYSEFISSLYMLGVVAYNESEIFVWNAKWRDDVGRDALLICFNDKENIVFENIDDVIRYQELRVFS